MISWQVAAHGPLLRLDTDVRDQVDRLRLALHSGLLDGLARLLADLGVLPALVVLVLTGAVRTGWSRRTGAARWWLPLLIAGLAAVTIPALVEPAKAWFARPGPLDLPLGPGSRGWYPSGHTATSAIGYGTAALLLGRHLTRPARRWLYIGTALLCAGVGAGLVWCDYHWLLDVLAAWCLAGLVLCGLGRLLSRADGERT